MLGEWVQYKHTNSLNTQEQIMKIRKNLEAVFLVAAVMATFASYATAEARVSSVAPRAAVTAPVDATMQVVVIKGHRLSAAEKAALN